MVKAGWYHTLLPVSPTNLCPAPEIRLHVRDQQATENKGLLSQKFPFEFPNQDTRLCRRRRARQLKSCPKTRPITPVNKSPRAA